MRGSLANTYSPGGARSPSMVGKVTAEVLEAKDLVSPVLEPLRPIVRISTGVTSFDTAVAATKGVQFTWRGASFVFPADAGTQLQVRVFHRPEGATGSAKDTLVGVGTVALSKKAQDTWLQLERELTADQKIVASAAEKKAGELRVKLQLTEAVTAAESDKRASRDGDRFAQTVVPSPGELPPPGEDGEYGQITLEIVRIKGMVMPENWIALNPVCTLSFEGKDFQTKTIKNSLSPFFHFRTGALPVKSPDEPLVITVYDDDNRAAGSGKLRPYGVAGYNFSRDVNWKEGNLELELMDSLDQIEAAEDKGTLVMRVGFRVSPLRTKAAEDAERPKWLSSDGTIELDYVPEIHGGVPIVPEDCKYVWYSMFHDNKFKTILEQRIIEGYLAEYMKSVASPGRIRAGRGSVAAEKPAKEQVPITMDTVVKREWKCTRMRHAFDLIRICAETVSGTGVLPIPETELHERRIKLAEMEAMREAVLKKSMQVRQELKRLWELFVTGKENPSFEEFAGGDKTFDEIHFKAIYFLAASTFMHGISNELAKSFADNEWAEKGWDPSGKLLKERKDEEGRPVKTAPVPSERFDACAMFLAAFWCDTLTEHETGQYFSVLTGFILDARKQVQKWQKPRRQRQSHAKVKLDNWRQVDHLDDLGRRKRQSVADKGERRGSARRASAAAGAGSPTSPKREKQAAIVDPEQEALDDREREVRERMRALEKQKRDDEKQQAKERRKSSTTGGKRASVSAGGGHGHGHGKRHSKKGSNKTPIQLAEDQVKHHFEKEEMNYQLLLNYINLNYGGLESKPRDLLKMDSVMLEMLLVRIYEEHYKDKHHRAKDPLKQALADYFELLRPTETRKELQGEQLGKYDIAEGTCKEIMAWCQTNPLKKCALICKRFTELAEPVIAERLRLKHGDPGWDSFESQLRGGAFSEEQCIALRQQISTGKLKRPAGLARVVADMACAVLGVENNGYWQPFKETLCQRTSHSLFAEFDLTQMTAARFHLCALIKRNSDAGIVAGTGAEKRQVQAHLIVTMTDDSVDKNVSPEMGAMYRWIRILMEYFGRYAGKPSHQEKYGWDHPPDFQVYWT
eukprot:Hpha_TRINITY_DN11020_c0_g2::TRINITY_DN11020_c0_g2_i1::g.92802::m.92802